MNNEKKPTIKPDCCEQTYHRDGTVSYWSVYQQVWVRRPADDIPDRELAAMTERQRCRVARAAVNREACTPW